MSRFADNRSISPISKGLPAGDLVFLSTPFNSEFSLSHIQQAANDSCQGIFAFQSDFLRILERQSIVVPLNDHISHNIEEV